MLNDLTLYQAKFLPSNVSKINYLMLLKPKLLTVHASSADEIVINNTNTKLIIVIGNVQNIRLIMDDPETIVYHRTFNYQDETGIIIGIEIDNLKPIYVQIKNSIAFPEVFSEVSQYGIANK